MEIFGKGAASCGLWVRVAVRVKVEAMREEIEDVLGIGSIHLEHARLGLHDLIEGVFENIAQERDGAFPHSRCHLDGV